MRPSRNARDPVAGTAAVGGDAVEQATAAPILLLAPVTRAILFPLMASSVGRRTHSQDVDH